jgi:hypothetical protein
MKVHNCKECGQTFLSWKEDHVQFDGTKRFSNTSATEAIEPLVDRLNIFQISLISNLEKFRYRIEQLYMNYSVMGIIELRMCKKI